MKRDHEEYLTREARKAANELSDAGVDRLLASTEAERRALAVQAIALGDVRAERRQLREAMWEALGTTRDLADDELGDDDGGRA